MSAYLVPALASLLGAALTAATLAAARVLRRWNRPRSAGTPASEAEGGVPSGGFGPAIAGDAVDPALGKLAHRTLGASLVLGLAALLFFARSSGQSSAVVPAPAAAIAILAAWSVAGWRR